MPSLLPATAQPLTQISIGEASVGSSYTSVGTFTSWLEIMIIVSTLDAAVQLSFDGVNAHIAIPAGNSEPVIFNIDFKSNLLTMPLTSVYVKRIGTPSAGSLYISGFSSSLQ